jgi:hypothetical protein
MAGDFRGKRVKWTHEEPNELGEPLTAVELGHLGEVGEVGEASSCYVDGRESHDEGYLVKFADGVEVMLMTDELELAE